MIRITKNNDEIIIRDISLDNFVKTGGITLVIFLLLFFKFNEMKEFPLFYIAALGLLSVGIYLLSLNQITTIKINKQKKTVSVQRKSLVKNKFNVYGFSEIANLIYVDKSKDDSGKISYKLLLPLESGIRIQLSSPVSFGQDQCFDAADVINNLIFDKPEKIPYSLTGFKKS